MKKIFLLFVLFSVLSSCDKNDDKNCSGADCLPPATQTGADTFGCLVNGVPFVDKSRSFNCYYQLVDGEYYFGIRGRQKKGSISQIFIGSEKKDIETGVGLGLVSQQDGNFYVKVSFDCANCFGATTTNENPGTIFFSRLDYDAGIVSGTFSFTITDPNTGTVYKITEGRFDTYFTQ